MSLLPRSRARRTLALALLAIVPAIALGQDGKKPQDAPKPPPRAAVPEKAEPARANATRSDASAPDEPFQDELTDEARDAINQGLDALASMQIERSGRWNANEGYGYDVAITALAGLAFLGAGEAPGRGRFSAAPYRDPLRKAIEFILRSQARAGPYPGLFYEGGEGHLDRREHRPMHGHGFALLFLAEAYGQTSAPELRSRIHEALKVGVQLTAKAQSGYGGWHYLPDGRQDEGSVTVTQIQGLRAARNAGIQVDRAVIDRAVDYIRKSQEPDGGIKYTIQYGHTSVALTAAGMAVLYGAGAYDDPALEKGFRYMRENSDSGGRRRFFFYEHLYLAQAMHQRGGPDWAAYYPRARSEVLRARGQRGVWDDAFAGKAYATACACLILEVPLRYLPIFQR